MNHPQQPVTSSESLLRKTKTKSVAFEASQRSPLQTECWQEGGLNLLDLDSSLTFQLVEQYPKQR